MPRLPFVLLCVFLLFPWIVTGAQTFSFTPTYPGWGPIAVADFNGDGKLDIVSQSRQVLLNNGDGTFRVGTSLNVNSDALFLATADFNGNGKPDIVFIPASGAVSIMVFLGNGDGTFQAPKITNPGFQAAENLMVADVNGDNKPDLLVSSDAGLVVFLGKGDGTFTELQPSSTVAYFQVVGDFNGDGKPDVAWGANYGGIAVALGNGDGTFQTPIVSNTNLVVSIEAVADFNGDGKLDVVVVAQSSADTLATLLGNGDGTFQAPTQELTAADILPGAYFEAVAVGDFNGDGKLDAVVTGGGFARMLFGNGDGTFTPGTAYVTGWRPGKNGSVSYVAVTDFNGDGKLDLAVGLRNDAHLFPQFVAVLIGNGDGSFNGELAVPGPSTPAVTGDFNRDGKPDIAAIGSVTNSATVDILLNSGTEPTSVTYSYPLPQYEGGPTAMAAADLNGDGILDLILASSNDVANTSSLIVFLGKGDGTFGNPIVLQYGTASDYVPAVVTGDFNGDHKTDVALVNGQLVVFLGNGDGTFGSPQMYYAGSEGTYSLGLGDFNNDGKLDVAVTTGAGVAIFLGRGDGTFQNVTFIGSGRYFFVVVADVNSDGKPDLVTNVQVFLGNGDGTFRALPAFDSPLGFYFTVADPNGDGKLDLVVQSPDPTIGLSVYPGNGDGTFAAPTNWPVLAGPIVLTADFNQDGRPDLAVLTNGWLMIAFNTTVADFTIGPAPGSSASATVSAGQSATFNLTVNSTGWFNGTVNLSCSITPSATPAPTCSLPDAVNVAKGTAVPVQVKVGTTGTMTTGSISNAGVPSGTILWVMVGLASGLFYVLGRRRLPAVAPTLVVFTLLSLVACGGGGSSSTSTQTTPGTPAGKYTITVTASAGSLRHSTVLTLNVE